MAGLIPVVDGHIIDGMEPVHLFRGAPCVRDWSAYKTVVEGWTCCGVVRRLKGSHTPKATADPSEVTCPHCLVLIAPKNAPKTENLNASR